MLGFSLLTVARANTAFDLSRTTVGAALCGRPLLQNERLRGTGGHGGPPLQLSPTFEVTDARIEDYEGRQITGSELVFEGSTGTPAAQAEFTALLKVAPNTTYSAVQVRDSLQALFDSGRVANARVEVIEEGTARTGPVRLRFVVHRQVQVGDIRIELGPVTGSPI